MTTQTRPGYGEPLRQTSTFSGGWPVKLEGNPKGPLGPVMALRGVPDFEHSTLCRIFNLDPNRFYFDLPSSVRGIGRNQSGTGGNGASGRVMNGYVMMSGFVTPVAKITVLRNERTGLRDDDPENERDFLDLNRT